MHRLVPSFVLSVSALALVACGDGADGSKAPVDRSATAVTAPNPLRDAIESATAVSTPATIGPTPSDAKATAPEQAQPVPPDPALVRIQILLDRSTFSPGLIDGLDGENVRQAAAAFRKARNLGEGDVLDPALLQALIAADAGPATTTYRLTQADVSGPFSPPPGADLAAQARNGVQYSTPLEKLAERFHVSETLLEALNPGVDFARAGQVLIVPAVSDAPLPLVARIEVDKAERSLSAYDAEGRLIAYYPATIGSGDNPTPSGDLKVNGVARAPDYTYDPAKLSYGPGGAKVVVPAGPNNPVGAVWIDLSRQSYGIHGTPDPAKVGKTASHGCVRLTNWDAQQLAAAVKPGVEVKFI